ncbi:hypothetical protein JCM3770_001679 [Rhodotorula araucariae]
MLPAAPAGADRPLPPSSVEAEWGDPASSTLAREREWPALKNTVFLDHAASPPAPLSPLNALSASIASTLFSNPHSASTSGVGTHLVIDQTRTRVLKDLFAVPDERVHEWDVVFVPGGATQAIKTVGDAWDWRPAADATTNGYEYLVESHTRHVSPASACNRFFTTCFHLLTAINPDIIKRANPFAAVLVDAAAYSSTSVLDLGGLTDCDAPDFVVASVYKIFGFPTSLGILIVRRASSHFLLRPSAPSYFGGGTLASLSLSAPFTHTPRIDPSGTVHQALEHGTPPYLEILALSHALDWLPRFTGGGGLAAVAAHTGGARVSIEHAAFVPEPEQRDQDNPPLPPSDKWKILLEPPGPIIGFSILLPPSAWSSADEEPDDFRRTHVGHHHFARLALLEGIALRSGGMCNAGAWTRAVGMGEEERRRLEELGAGRCWDEEEFAPFAPFRPLGMVRVSFGLASTIDDVHAFVSFVKRFFVSTDEMHALEAVVPRGVSAPSAVGGQSAVARARLTELYIYPIKSCGAQQLEPSTSWPLTPTGLLHDREWMLVSSSTGRALSMKRYMRMALIRPSVDRARGILRVEAAGMRPLELPLAPRPAYEMCGLPTPPLSEDGHASEGDADGGASPRATTLCSATVFSQRFSSTADEWFTAFLNPPAPSSSATAGPGPVELHRLPVGATRHAHFDGVQGPPLPLRLSNESPFLLVSGESLRAVNGWIDDRAAHEGTAERGEEVRATAFRPNLVVEGVEAGTLEPWWEERIEALRIGTEAGGGGGTFSFLGRCRRCLMVSIDQRTGVRTAEPLTTLSLKHKNPSNGRVEFGAHMLWREELSGGSEGGDICVRVGDEVRVQLRGEK